MAGLSFNISTDGTFGQYKEDIINKMKNGDNEPSIQIGGKAYTQSQWKKVLDDFDKIEETIVEESQKEFEDRRKKEQNSKEMLKEINEAYLTEKKVLGDLRLEVE